MGLRDGQAQHSPCSTRGSSDGPLYRVASRFTRSTRKLSSDHPAGLTYPPSAVRPGAVAITAVPGPSFEYVHPNNSCRMGVANFGFASWLVGSALSRPGKDPRVSGRSCSDHMDFNVPDQSRWRRRRQRIPIAVGEDNHRARVRMDFATVNHLRIGGLRIRNV
jgi:hypothetical protein